ncbi:hypothetical protein B7P43_G18452 [Cryptotermes secundus]|uniref:Uncharacterized protein n=1 Tax=Cryptotermes secundus TaxID=105785 RepID=A0A2J7PNP0_9NEOP|nr:hypothetical protein B7P43_G18452 [Cryptotermes secundus]
MFERKIIRKIYGPVMENNMWRIRYNEEINALLKGEYIVRYQVSENKMKKTRPRMRWLDDVENDLKKMKVKGWVVKMRNREQWIPVVEEAKAHPRL